ncbi:MAG: glycosyltransferase family 2 protein [bacterium]|nr:glycosyltransferase family 2 protein [bacterium]
MQSEVLIVDNASTDGTVAVVTEYIDKYPNIHLVTENDLGYGSACLKGFRSAKGRYLFIADADGSYNFTEIPLFLTALKNGSDFVVGNRFKSKMSKGTMPWLHRYIGNPVLSRITKSFFNIKINDIHCGARAISKISFEKLTLYTRGMEFASEMIIKAAKKNLKISEVSVSYRKRFGTSKLRSFQDGWRHLRFILLYSPLQLFLIPGFILCMTGFLGMILLNKGSLHLFDLQLYVHPLFFCALMIIGGYQLILFGGFAKTYAITHLGDTNWRIQHLFKYITLERAGSFGIILAIAGGVLYFYIVTKWVQSGFGSLDEIKNSIIALTLFVVGIQTFFSAFMLSIVGIKEK